MTIAHSLTVHILTEDSGRDAPGVLQALGPKILVLGAPQCQAQKVLFAPCREHQTVVSANKWKSKAPGDQRAITELCGFIAAEVGRGNAFVFFHVDGDVTWTQRTSSENRSKFTQVVETRVREFLKRPRRTPATLTDADSAFSRLVLVMPFYSIEAWLYQNTEEAKRVCKTHHLSACLDTFSDWAAHRGELDEIPKIKDESGTCLRSKYNLDLATNQFPAQEVYAVKKSFAAVVDHIRQDPVLQQCLAATFSDSASEEERPDQTNGVEC